MCSTVCLPLPTGLGSRVVHSSTIPWSSERESVPTSGSPSSKVTFNSRPTCLAYWRGNFSGASAPGEETEMDSLELEIWTDGRISPQNALEEAARILRDHLQPFMGNQVVEKDVVLTEEETKMFKLLSHDVEILDLSVRAMNCLNSANIKLIGELCTKTESRMLKYRNFGKKSLDEIKEKIEKLGLELGMSFSDRLMAALEAESVRVRSEVEETK